MKNNTIYKSNTYTITSNNNTFSILFSENINNFSLVSSIQNNIKKSIIGSDFNIIYLNINNIKTFNTFFNENKNNIHIQNIILKLVHDLTKQLKYLINTHNKCFIGYNLNNIFVINNTHFIYIDNEYLLNINNQYININVPFSNNDFYLSPELLTITELPTSIHYKSTFYSFIILLINILIDIDIDLHIKNINLDLEYLKYNNINDYYLFVVNNLIIQNTKIYFFIQRCLKNNPNERLLLFL